MALSIASKVCPGFTTFWLKLTGIITFSSTLAQLKLWLPDVSAQDSAVTGTKYQ